MKKRWVLHEEIHKKWMKDPKYRDAYEKLEPEFTLASAMIETRIKKKLSQQDLAKRVGTGQAVISRLEGMNASPSMSLIQRVADALGLKVELKFTPR